MNFRGYDNASITNLVMKAFNNVYSKLGSGFPTGVYGNALIIELRKINVFAESKKTIEVYYEGEIVGEMIADVIVEGHMLIIIQAKDEISSEDECKMMNYLKAANMEMGMILNFGERPEFKRKILI